MGSALEMAFRVRKIVVISIRTCYRSVRKYPFLAGLLCFLIILYRSCPFLFSLLVSASPVIICTAVLLGTLLSFGQPNIPEIEVEEKVSYDVASLRSGVLENTTVVAAEDENFAVDRFKGNEVDNSFVETDFAEDRKTSKLEEPGDLVDFGPLIRESDCELQFGKGEVEKVVEREFHSSELEKRRTIYEENLDVKSLAVEGETAVENQHFLGHSTGNENLEVETHDIPVEPLHKEDHVSNDDEDDYDSSDSGSDRAESSSPDASLADIIPMLDELHPLLDLDAPQPILRSNEESDASSEQSHKSDSECVISDDDAVNQGEEVAAAYNDDEEDDDDDGMQEEKEDDSKSAIKWTEDDQKNLMDLGSLELERNQRLENLIARRRTRNNLRMLAGKNLIDLDGFDLPTNVPTISTTRKNPFDLPYDSYDNTELPPIPGSAPSILLPRRNPFDIPYDPNEEKPDLKSDNFEQEFLPSQQKDAFFRRHESFNVGPSSYEVFKQEQQNIRWKPYFTMPEKTAAEGTSYSPLERQSSQVSETKLSSVSDTESTGSITDEDDKKPDESQSYMETAAVSYLDHTTIHIEHGTGSWEDVSAGDFVQVENRDVHHEVIEITLGSTEGHLGSKSGSSEIGAVGTSMVTASEIHAKNEVAETEYSSNSSLSSLSEIDEKPAEAKMDEVKPGFIHVEESSTLIMQRSLGDEDFKIPVEPEAREIHSNVVAETDYSSNSSLSSLSEVNEKPFEVKTDEVKASSSHVEESGISTQPSLQDTDFKISNELLDENQPEEPVYDSSPSGRESEVYSEIGQDDTPGFKDMHVHAHSGLYSVNENEPEPGEVSEVIKNEVTMVEPSNVETKFDAQNSSAASELLVEHVSTNSGLSLDERVGSSPSGDQISPQSSFAEAEDQLSTVRDHVPADTLSPSNAKPVETHGALNDETSEEQAKFHSSSLSNSSFAEEVILQDGTLCHADQAYASTSNHGSEIPTQVLHDIVGIKSVATSHEHVTNQEDKQVVAISSLETSPSELEQAWSDKPMVEPPLNDFEAARETGTSTDSSAKINSKDITPKGHQDVSTGFTSMASDSASVSSDNPDVNGVGADLRDDIINEVVSEDCDEISKHLDSLAEAYGSRFSENAIKEEVDEITEIDEELLSELDRVGDFNTQEVGEPIIEKKPEQTDLASLRESSHLIETKPELPILEARSIDDINLAFRQLHEGVDVEEVILPSAIESRAKEEAKVETTSDLEVVEARSLGDINVALIQVAENNSSELPKNTVSNDQSVGEEPTVTDSTAEVASSNTADANKPADTDEKSSHPNLTVSNTEETKKKSKNSKSGSGSSSSSSSSSSDSD